VSAGILSEDEDDKRLLKEWLQLGRAQTYPASWLLVVAPLLHGRSDPVQVFVLSLLMWFAHILTFGHNSLMDSCIIPEKDKPPPDFVDPSKSHHPLIQGVISLHEAKIVIFWGLGLLASGFLLFTVWSAVSRFEAIASLFLYWAWGVLYNEGLSKESPLGFLSISLSFTAMGSWAWFLSHDKLGALGALYVVFIFFTILFQISYSGHLKELGVEERSNILVKMGAKIEDGKFKPGLAGLYGIVVKTLNLLIAGMMLAVYTSLSGGIASIFLMALASIFLLMLVESRIYNRKRELMVMSGMEIVTIFIAVFVLLPPIEAIVLAALGIAYFFIVNKLIWAVPYPAV